MMRRRAALDAAVEAARRCRRRLAAAAGEGAPFGPIEALLAAGARHRLRARQGAGGGLRLETELAEPDGAWSRPAPRRWALEACRAAGALGRRLEAVLEDAPDWLDSPAGARVEGAINGLSWRRETLAAWIALLGRSAAAPTRFRRLAGDRAGRGREYDVAIHRRWLDPTGRCGGGDGAGARACLVTSATLRGGDGWDTAEDADRGAALPGLAGHFEADSPVSTMRPAPKS
jgi:ATP-dependent DNA helicase DinG